MPDIEDPQFLGTASRGRRCRAAHLSPELTKWTDPPLQRGLFFQLVHGSVTPIYIRKRLAIISDGTQEKHPRLAHPKLKCRLNY
jgi:hypothetical protein